MPAASEMPARRTPSIMAANSWVIGNSSPPARSWAISSQPPWCTDQRDGRIDPTARPGSRDADGRRAAELQHPVQDVDADGGLGRLTAVRARPQRVADHPLVTGHRRLDQGTTVVAGGLLPAQAAALGDEPK